ncbi:type II secretion system secretin GspD [Diaphorobacter aerolatus]|uniref:Type II secretion system secretin GspD n=1 Tax=Diaphorobacter aerolatus TaxID=1288495 RepID=A0A7H0GNM7_9BURK|nr:type II secretion system secretin GspD [Diaphorobacter aerolatus]QNP49893.1 type II secretion system secretin GspD [Diaphorobacter aerolatus]
MTLLPSYRLRTALHSIAASTLVLCASVPLQAIAAPQGSVQSNEPVTLNFANADIEAVARTIATITGRNVVVDPRVKGQLTLVTDKPVAPSAAFQQFLSALRLQGFTIVESAGLYKVVPEADAKLQSGGVTVTQGSSGTAPGGGQIATQIFKLNFENANNLVPVLRPLISPNNTINVNPGNNSLVITDYGDNLQRIARIIAAMDVSNASDVEVIPLQNAIASDLAPLVQRLVDGSGSATTATGTPTPAATGQTDSAYRTTLLAEPRSNALIVRAANPARLALVRSLVAKLDQAPVVGSAASTGNIHVVYLKNADAVKLAATLRAAISNGSVGGGGSGSNSGSGLPFSGSGGGMSGGMTNTSSTSPTQNSGLGGNASGGGLGAGSMSGIGNSQNNANQGSTGGQIQADPSTNSLIISAPEPQYRQIRAVIDKLDGRRAQVLIESLIVEVSANKVAEFGIQWQGIIGKYGSTLGLLGVNSSQTGTNILDLALAAASGNVSSIGSALGNNKPNGGTIAVAPRINGNYYLGALANFLENTGDANVLSTPNLLTLDNEEAQIIIGENVPFVTGSYANSTGSATVNPFTTVERKDVGLMLRVRPQISENGTVKLTLYQEISKVNNGTVTNANGPTTSKRAIESSVLVQDGNVIVIGGLLEDAYQLGQDKVPLMGDLPLVGGLFRNESRSRRKTNLMVFLRPVVIRDDATSDALVQDRYDAIRALQMNTQPADSVMMRSVNNAPILPPLSTQTSPSQSGRASSKPVPAPMLPMNTEPPRQARPGQSDWSVQDPNFKPQ